MASRQHKSIGAMRLAGSCCISPQSVEREGLRAALSPSLALKAIAHGRKLDRRLPDDPPVFVDDLADRSLTAIPPRHARRRAST
jgi:hypothetical protein